jgi:two-component system, NarL family, nitrate/nitrite response regulator NarL
MGDTKLASKCPEVELLQAESKSPRLRSNGALAGTVFEVPPLERPSNEAKICDRASGTGQALVVETKTPALSEREIQVLDGLVKGHANKVIARGCGVTEATVKVHMKSILRKIRACNRTQAAIWALEHGYAGEEPKAVA